MSTEEHKDYSRLMARSLRQVIVNWMTLKPFFKWLFSVPVVMKALVGVMVFDLIRTCLGIVSGSEGFDLFTALDRGLEDATGISRLASHMYSVFYNVVWLGFGLVAYRYFKQQKNAFLLDDAKHALKRGVISSAEYQIRGLEIEQQEALDKLSEMRRRGIIDSIELGEMQSLTRSRYAALIKAERLKLAMRAGIISQEEYKSKLPQVLAASQSEFGEAMESLHKVLAKSMDASAEAKQEAD